MEYRLTFLTAILLHTAPNPMRLCGRAQNGRVGVALAASFIARTVSTALEKSLTYHFLPFMVALVGCSDLDATPRTSL